MEQSTTHVTCLVCGASFAPKRLRGASKGLYCSKVCAGRAVGLMRHAQPDAAHPLLATRGASPRTGEVRTCLVCGSEFYAKPHRAKNPDAGKYCSFACKNRARKRPAEERFWEHVDRSGGPDACWPWTGARDKDGYGLFSYRDAGGRKRQIVAHRFAYETANPPLGKAKALHSCDNPPCCRPSHVHPGTNADNMREMVERDRSMRGERHPRAVITEDDVRAIRAARPATWPEYGALARRYGVSDANIWMIVTRRSWKHVV